MPVIRVFVNGKPYDQVAREKSQLPRNSTPIYIYKDCQKKYLWATTKEPHGPVKSYAEEIAFIKDFQALDPEYLRQLSSDELITLACVKEEL